MSTSATTPIARPSLTEPLVDRYNKSVNLANVGGGSAKDVGTSRAQTNAVDGAQLFSNQFQVKQPAGFTAAAEKYSTDVLKVPTTKYAPSGRR